ncbi:MarR family winged helix-turn-helix transcriptional regulator [Microbacterium allomyrinae]|uniref:MarR family transcriptional regulator n=1 Tax=Microbacterium allomyrinae TaxID=2830666 RepID=A0A9X1LW85_9MICO|nr:MarR family transcriptional regulator [Microbacterium allomyrinae]MCC2033250.1 MarR family transcriptional regulator [Microbacterium allomyrinae]
MSIPDAAAIAGAHALSLGLTRTPGHLLRRGLATYNAIWADEVGSDPTSAQFAVLAALATSPGIDQRAVGELASLDRSSTTDVVQRLARRAWITKSRDPADARRAVLDLTVPAAHALELLTARAAAVHDRLLAPLDADQRIELLAGLRSIARLPPGRISRSDHSPLEAPGFLIRRAQQMHTALFAEEFGDDMTGPQFAVLHTLRNSPGISHRTLRSVVRIDRTTVTGIVDRLGQRGWIGRERDPADARRFRLTLTPAAEAIYDDLAERVETVQQRLVLPLSAQEREGFLPLLFAVATQRSADGD